MEASLLSVLLSILVVPFLAIAWTALNWVWFRPRRRERILRQQGLSGNSYRFLTGDLNDSERMLRDAKSRPSSLSDDVKTLVLPFFHQVVKTYGTYRDAPTLALSIFSFMLGDLIEGFGWMVTGKNSFIWVCPMPRVNIMDPAQLKEIFSKIHDYQKADGNPLFMLLLEGLVSHEGDKWSMHRQILNPAFHMGKLKLMLPAFHSSSEQLINKWEESSEVDIWPELQDLTRDIISQTAFGTSIEEGRKIFQLQEEQSELALVAVQSVYIPGWRFVPTKLNRRMRKIEYEIRSLIRDLVHRKEKDIKAGKSVSDNLLGLMIESNMKEIQEHGHSDKKVSMSIDDVIEECKLFYFAGQETTSTLLVWTILLLSVHPEWQQRAREEVLQVFGDSQRDFDQLNHLNVVTMILNEVMRLYPPVIMLSRKVTKEMKLGDVTLPKGALVALPTILVHHDSELWGEDAMEFKPERFAEGVAKATKNRVIFFPFGWGPRICIGMNFALLKAKLALAMILQKFSFELSPNYTHAPKSIVTLQPQHGAQVILRKYEN